MHITDELLEKMARLSRLRIAPNERESMRDDFQRMVDFVDKLREVDTEGVEPLTYMTDGVHVLADDTPETPLPVSEVLKNAPDATDTSFKVPPMGLA